MAIVTGGTGSVGSAVCAALAGAGWTCLAADITGPAGQTHGWAYQRLDVTCDNSIAEMVARASSLGHISALVNAHGLLRGTPWDRASDEVVDAILEVNLKGVFRVTQAVAGMIADGGAIVSLSSVTASMGRTRDAYAYQAAKAGIEAFTRTMSIALAPRGVRVNCIQAGYLSEPMRGEGSVLRARQGGNEELAKFTPSGRLVTPQEVAAAVAFLCSPASSGISGVVLPVDGGQLAY